MSVTEYTLSVDSISSNEGVMKVQLSVSNNQDTTPIPMKMVTIKLEFDRESALYFVETLKRDGLSYSESFGTMVIKGFIAFTNKPDHLLLEYEYEGVISNISLRITDNSRAIILSNLAYQLKRVFDITV